MGRIGRERVMTHLAWDHSVPGLLAAYERCYPKPAGSAKRQVAAGHHSGAENQEEVR